MFIKDPFSIYNIRNFLKRSGMLSINHSLKQCFCFIEYDNCNKRRVWRYQREVIRIRKSKKNKQNNDQRKKYKRTNNDLQNIHIKLMINTNPTKNRGWTQVLRKGGHILLYYFIITVYLRLRSRLISLTQYLVFHSILSIASPSNLRLVIFISVCGYVPPL